MTYLELVAAIQSYTENTFPTTSINTFIQQAEQRIYNNVQFPAIRKNTLSNISAGGSYITPPAGFLSVYSFAIIDTATSEYTYLLNKDVNFLREAYPNPNDLGVPKYYAVFGMDSSTNTSITLMVAPAPAAAQNIEIHYYSYPTSIIQGPIITLSFTTTGDGYVDGIYYNVPLLNGTGSSATLSQVAVAGGVVQSVTLGASGSDYIIGDTLSISNSYLGGTGSGATFTVSSTNGTTWLSYNFDSVLLYGSLVEAYTYMKGEPDMVALYDSKYKEALALAKRLGDGLERQDAYRSGQFRQAVT
jgi:hypothetical protein